jgi:hypothetical protein
MTTAIFLAFVLVILAFAFHYRVFTTLATHTPRLKLSKYNQWTILQLSQLIQKVFGLLIPWRNRKHHFEPRVVEYRKSHL